MPLNQLGERELCPGRRRSPGSTRACVERARRASDRPAQRHRHPPVAGHARGDGRGRGGRRRLRRRSDRQSRCEARAAALFGMEAGLFFPSGTQSNLAALMAHCARGEEVIVGQDAHTYRYEGGGGAVLGSIQPQPLAEPPRRHARPRDGRGGDQARRRALRRHAAPRAREHHRRQGDRPRLPGEGDRRSRGSAGSPRTSTARASSTPR